MIDADFFLDADIVAEKFQQCIIAGNPREGSLGIGFRKLFHRQVRGNHGGFASKQALVDAEEQAGYREGIAQLRSQIIDDQQITIKNMMMDLRYILVPVKNILFKYIK